MSRLASITSYARAVPRILTVQLVTDTLFALCATGLKALAAWALLSQGRVAVTTGDFAFMFTSWQGILLIVLAFLALYLSVAIDVCSMVAFAGNWVRGKSDSAFVALRDGLRGSLRFLCPEGLLVVLYMALLAPIAGSQLSIPLTKKWYVPSFITSVIYETPSYLVLYLVLIAAFFVVGFFGVFVVHGVVLDDLSVRESARRSITIIRKHWFDYVMKMFGFSVTLSAGSVLFAFVLLIPVGLGLFGLYQAGYQNYRFFEIFAVLSYIITTLALLSFGSSLTTVKMTERYLEYTDGKPDREVLHRRRHHPFMVMAVLVIFAVITLVAYAGSENFDEMFPAQSDVRVIAHRACGVEGVENSVAGLDIAAGLGAWGAEIDIQRTADGAYVVNHDDTFKRVTGDPRSPWQMTLAEVQTLTIANTADRSAPGEPVPTYEDMLEGARDNVILFVELKGKTADRQMADDAVRIAKEHDMLDQCVFISLKYDLIDYLEKNYPDVKTGFLAFASYGDTAALNTDYLALEEEAMNPTTVQAIHDQGKQALVWTVNDKTEQQQFLLADVDAIITDQVVQAEQIREELARRDDIERITDTCLKLAE